MASEKQFQEFLSNIEPSKSTKEAISSIQSNLRSYLANHERYKNIYLDSFLSGSYAKKTSIRPKKGDGKRDVDIVIVTNHNADSMPKDILDELYDVLSESAYYQNVEKHSHSIGIELSNLEIDVVPVIRIENEKYLIGDGKTNKWSVTNPKGHLEWCSNVNKTTNGKFIPCVKLFKWWRLNNFGGGHDYPKGITLEKMLADNRPNPTLNTEEFFTESMRLIANNYLQILITGAMPRVNDPCIPNNNLFEQYSYTDLLDFFLKMMEQLKLIDEDKSSKTWRTIFGNEFPSDDSNDLGHRGEREEFIDEIVPVKIEYNLTIDCKVLQDGFRPFMLSQYVYPLKHKLGLDFFIKSTDTPKPYKVYWKIRNVGEEAVKRHDVRGQILKTDEEIHHEKSCFQGPHFTECYIIKDGVCVARDRIKVPIGNE